MAAGGYQASEARDGSMLVGRLGSHRGHYALVVVATASLTVMATLGLGRFAYPVILPVMQQGLGLTSIQSGALATSNLLGFLVASVVGGVLAGHWGARRTIVCGLGLTAAGLLLTGLAASWGVALTGQLLTGLGAGIGTIPAMGLAAAWFAPVYRGRASGVISAGSGPGMLLAGLLLPPLMGGKNWQTAWFCIAALVLGLAGVAWVLIRNRPGEIGLVPLGADREATFPEVAQASGWRVLLRASILWHLGGVFALFGLAYTSYLTFFPAYLVRQAGLGESAAGGVWGMTGTVGVIGALVWGSISDALGRRQALAVVFLLFTMAFVASALAPGPVGYYAAPVLFGLTFWATPTIMAAAAGDYFGERLVYPSIGLLAVFSAVGQALGPSLAGLSVDYTASFSSAFLLAAGVSLAAFALSLLLPPPGRISTGHGAPG